MPCECGFLTVAVDLTLLKIQDDARALVGDGKYLFSVCRAEFTYFAIPFNLLQHAKLTKAPGSGERHRAQGDLINDGNEWQARQTIVSEFGQGEIYAPIKFKGSSKRDTRNTFHAFPLEVFCAFSCAMRWGRFH